MKFLPLVWAGLWRRPVRAILTGLCIAIAFLLLGLLDGVNAGFAKAIADAHRDLLVTSHPGPRWWTNAHLSYGDHSKRPRRQRGRSTGVFHG
jgi:hypothetical protein